MRVPESLPKRSTYVGLSALIGGVVAVAFSILSGGDILDGLFGVTNNSPTQTALIYSGLLTAFAGIVILFISLVLVLFKSGRKNQNISPIKQSGLFVVVVVVVFILLAACQFLFAFPL